MCFVLCLALSGLCPRSRVRGETRKDFEGALAGVRDPGWSRACGLGGGGGGGGRGAGEVVGGGFNVLQYEAAWTLVRPSSPALCVGADFPGGRKGRSSVRPRPRALQPIRNCWAGRYWEPEAARSQFGSRVGVKAGRYEPRRAQRLSLCVCVDCRWRSEPDQQVGAFESQPRGDKPGY